MSINVEDDDRADVERRPRRRKPLLVKMLVFDIKNDVQIRELEFDFNDTHKRHWAMRVQLWAFFNNHSVELLTVQADELARIAEQRNDAKPKSDQSLPDSLLPKLR